MLLNDIPSPFNQFESSSQVQQKLQNPQLIQTFAITIKTQYETFVTTLMKIQQTSKNDWSLLYMTDPYLFHWCSKYMIKVGQNFHSKLLKYKKISIQFKPTTVLTKQTPPFKFQHSYLNNELNKVEITTILSHNFFAGSPYFTSLSARQLYCVHVAVYQIVSNIRVTQYIYYVFNTLRQKKMFISPTQIMRSIIDMYTRYYIHTKKAVTYNTEKQQEQLNGLRMLVGLNSGSIIDIFKIYSDLQNTQPSIFNRLDSLMFNGGQIYDFLNKQSSLLQKDFKKYESQALKLEVSLNTIQQVLVKDITKFKNIVQSLQTQRLTKMFDQGKGQEFHGLLLKQWNKIQQSKSKTIQTLQNAQKVIQNAPIQHISIFESQIKQITALLNGIYLQWQDFSKQLRLTLKKNQDRTQYQKLPKSIFSQINYLQMQSRLKQQLLYKRIVMAKLKLKQNLNSSNIKLKNMRIIKTKTLKQHQQLTKQIFQHVNSSKMKIQLLAIKGKQLLQMQKQTQQQKSLLLELTNRFGGARIHENITQIKQILLNNTSTIGSIIKKQSDQGFKTMQNLLQRLQYNTQYLSSIPSQVQNLLTKVLSVQMNLMMSQTKIALSNLDKVMDDLNQKDRKNVNIITEQNNQLKKVMYSISNTLETLNMKLDSITQTIENLSLQIQTIRSTIDQVYTKSDQSLQILAQMRIKMEQDFQKIASNIDDNKIAFSQQRLQMLKNVQKQSSSAMNNILKSMQYLNAISDDQLKEKLQQLISRLFDNKNNQQVKESLVTGMKQLIKKSFQQNQPIKKQLTSKYNNSMQIALKNQNDLFQQQLKKADLTKQFTNILAKQLNLKKQNIEGMIKQFVDEMELQYKKIKPNFQSINDSINKKLKQYSPYVDFKSINQKIGNSIVQYQPQISFDRVNEKFNKLQSSLLDKINQFKPPSFDSITNKISKSIQQYKPNVNINPIQSAINDVINRYRPNINTDVINKSITQQLQKYNPTNTINDILKNKFTSYQPDVKPVEQTINNVLSKITSKINDYQKYFTNNDFTQLKSSFQKRIMELFQKGNTSLQPFLQQFMQKLNNIKSLYNDQQTMQQQQVSYANNMNQMLQKLYLKTNQITKITSQDNLKQFTRQSVQLLNQFGQLIPQLKGFKNIQIINKQLQSSKLQVNMLQFELKNRNAQIIQLRTQINEHKQGLGLEINSQLKDLKTQIFQAINKSNNITQISPLIQKLIQQNQGRKDRQIIKNELDITMVSIKTMQVLKKFIKDLFKMTLLAFNNQTDQAHNLLDMLLKKKKIDKKTAEIIAKQSIKGRQKAFEQVVKGFLAQQYKPVTQILNESDRYELNQKVQQYLDKTYKWSDLQKNM